MVFTEKTAGTKFPENTYEVNTTEEVDMIIHNCTERISGVRLVEVWINEPDDRGKLISGLGVKDD